MSAILLQKGSSESQKYIEAQQQTLVYLHVLLCSVIFKLVLLKNNLCLHTLEMTSSAVMYPITGILAHDKGSIASVGLMWMLYTHEVYLC